jgi:hypothetical protein
VGCAALVIASAGTCVAAGALGFDLLSFVSTKPKEFVVDYSAPDRVESGREFELIVALTNAGDSEIHVGEIILDEAGAASILDGAIVIGTEPQMETEDWRGLRSFNYDRDIPAGEQRRVTLYLRATTPGQFGSWISVQVGDLATSD